MTNTVILKRSSVANAVPTVANLTEGELALNYTDGNLFYKTAGNTINVIASNKFLSVTGNVTGGNIVTSGIVTATGNITGGNLITVGQISATGTITSNAATNSTGFAVGNGAVSNVALGMFPTAGTAGEYAIRDYSNVFTNMYFDVGMGGTANGAFQFRTSNSFRLLANVNSSGISTPLAISATGNITGSYFIGNGSQLTGITVAAGSSIVNGTSNVVVAASGNITVGVAGTAAVATFTTAGIVSNSVATTNNGAGTNFKVGDDVWLGDVNTADTMSIRGQQNAANGYVVFGNADATTKLGRAGSGPLTYDAAFSAVGNVTGGNVITVGIMSSTGNATHGNINTAGVVSATGNVTGGNLITAGLITATGTITSAANVTGANLVTGGLVSATGNIIGGNLSGTSIIGTLTTAAQTNITSVGTLGSLSVTGNTTSGNLLTGGQLSATGNVTGANVNTNNIVGSAVTITSTGALNLAPSGNITANSKNITGVADPVQSQDAATKNYVDTVAQGLDAKASVNVATTTALPSYTYSNGSSGVGATLTATATGVLTIDGQTVALNDRVLVKNETGSPAAAYNGIYLCTTAGAVGVAYVLTRATDFNQPAEMYSAFTFVEYGTTNGDTGWVCTNNSSSPITIGTTAITFTQFSGAGSYTAGTGLTLTGTQFSVSNTAVTTGSYGNSTAIATFTVNQQGQLTAAGTASINAPASLITGTTLSSNVTTSSLTTVGTLGSLSVTGNVNSGNVVTTGQVSAAGNITGFAVSAGNISTDGTVSATGGIYGNTVTASYLINSFNLSATGNVTGANIISVGSISAGANVTGGNLTTTGLVSATGNVTGNYILGNGALLTGIVSTVSSLSNGNSNVSINSAGGNVSTSVNGIADALVVAPNRVDVLGALNINGLLSTAKVITANSVVADNMNSLVISPLQIGNGVSVTVPSSSTMYIFTPT